MAEIASIAQDLRGIVVERDGDLRERSSAIEAVEEALGDVGDGFDVIITVQFRFHNAMTLSQAGDALVTLDQALTASELLGWWMTNDLRHRSDAGTTFDAVLQDLELFGPPEYDLVGLSTGSIRGTLRRRVRDNRKTLAAGTLIAAGAIMSAPLAPVVVTVGGATLYLGPLVGGLGGMLSLPWSKPTADIRLDARTQEV